MPDPTPLKQRAEREIVPTTRTEMRDWFAGQALIGLLAGTEEVIPHEVAARGAYLYADAMLKARIQK